MKKRILIVEDDIEFAILICEYLESENFETCRSEGGIEIYGIIKNFIPEMILMDRNLHGIDGVEIVKVIRTNNEVPVIFITSITDEPKVIEGLGLSNCEYLKKPFGLIELKLRIERHFHLTETEQLFFSKKYYMPEQYALKKGDQIIRLSKYENALLLFLLENQQKICSLESIIYNVWGDNDIERLNRVDVLIKKLREKLDGIPFVIESHKRVGYVLKKID
ncbi:MAG: DNA-binding response regulator [uncultured bacterium]|nr:MAG: DNA-binding response regulator [uncultured bacterium]